jgi:sentrin-specific protease 1
VLFYERTANVREVARELSEIWQQNILVDLVDDEDDETNFRGVDEASDISVGNVTVKQSTLRRLMVPESGLDAAFRSDYYLDDSIVNAYLKLIQIRSEITEGLPKVLCMDSYFYDRLSKGKQYHAYADNVDLFSYDLVIFPINLESLVHWTLVVLSPIQDASRAQPLTYYDPLYAGQGKTWVVDETVKRNLESYLNVKYHETTGTYDPRVFDMQEPSVVTPRQTDNYNCGVFLCKYVEILSRGLALPARFGRSEVDHMRTDIRVAIENQILPAIKR